MSTGKHACSSACSCPNGCAMAMAERVANRFESTKTASTEEQWEMASEILAKKEEHAAIKVIKGGYDAVLKAIEVAAEKSANIKKYGGGRTEDPTFVVSEVVPAIEELAADCEAIAKQMRSRLDH